MVHKPDISRVIDIADQTALCEALTSGKIGTAYLDVFETEPLPEESPLWDMENVLVTPHCSDMITDWDVKAAEFFLANVQRYLRGKPLINVVRSPKEQG